jgi:hypothetical protein
MRHASSVVATAGPAARHTAADASGAGSGTVAGVTNSDRDGSRQAAPGGRELLGMGATIGGCVALGVFLGVFADHELGTTPLLAIVGLFLGIVLGAAGAYQVVRPYVRNGPRKG